MKSKLHQGFIILFFVASALNILGIGLELKSLSMACKPVIIPSLILHLLLSNKALSRGYYLALLFSFLGDVLLMFEGNQFFLSGIGSFLITQISFSYLLFPSFKRSSTFNKLLGSVLFLTYFLGLVSFMYPNLGDFKIPVLIYGFTICIFGYFSFLTWRTVEGKSPFIIFGAVLFIISDSMIALNTFYFHENIFTYWVMITYVGAQYLISRHFLKNTGQKN